MEKPPEAVQIAQAAPPAAQAEAARSPLLAKDKPDIFRILHESGFFDIADLTDAMNRQPEVAAKGGEFNVTVDQVSAAISNPQEAFGGDKASLGIIYYRIAQTVNKWRAANKLGDLSPETLFGTQKQTPQGTDADGKLARAKKFIHESILNVLDKPKGKHIQTFDHLFIDCANPAKVRAMLDNPDTAYTIKDDDKFEPSSALVELAKSIGTEPGLIISPTAWGTIYALKHGVNPVAKAEAETAKPATATVIPTVHTPAPILPPAKANGAGANGATSPRPRQKTAGIANGNGAAHHDVRHAAVTAAPAAPLKPQAATSAPAVVADFQKAAIEIMKAYYQLGNAERAFLRKVEGINLDNVKTDLYEAGVDLGYEADDAVRLFEQTKAILVKASKEAGADVSFDNIANALRIFGGEKLQSVLTLSLKEGKEDTEIGARLGLKADGVKDARANLLGRMAEALSGKPALQK